MGEMVGISMNETMVLFFSNVVNFDSPTSDSGTKELIVNERTSYYQNGWRFHLNSFWEKIVL